MAAISTATPVTSVTPPTALITPEAQFTPAAACLDQSNLWLVTTSCYLRAPRITTPDWLTCSITHFGPPAVNDYSCYMSAQRTTSGSETTYYTECPVGYTAVVSRSEPGHTDYRNTDHVYDITRHIRSCCPK
jgi:hypothetical protein